MKKSTIWLLTIVMASTIMGLLFVQIMYMEDMVRMRNEQFSETVKRSLYAVSDALEQDERWQAQYDQMMTFMNENHRRPSKHRLEEHDMLNWYKHVKKAIAKSNYPPHRIEKFALLQQVANKYRRKNQYE